MTKVPCCTRCNGLGMVITSRISRKGYGQSAAKSYRPLPKMERYGCSSSTKRWWGGMNSLPLYSHPPISPRCVDRLIGSLHHRSESSRVRCDTVYQVGPSYGFGPTDSFHLFRTPLRYSQSVWETSRERTPCSLIGCVFVAVMWLLLVMLSMARWWWHCRGRGC